LLSKFGNINGIWFVFAQGSITLGRKVKKTAEELYKYKQYQYTKVDTL
jgi:hypothetical protein